MKVAFLTKSITVMAGGLLPAMQAIASGVTRGGRATVKALGVHERLGTSKDPDWGPIDARSFPFKGPYALGYSPAMARGLTEAAPDILHTHGVFYYTSYLSNSYSRRCHIPYLASPHGMLDPWALANSRWKKVLAGHLFEKRHMGGAALVHSLCEAETRAVRAYGIRQAVAEIPNGVDIPESNDCGPPPWCDRVEEGRKVLLFLGRIHPKKGLSALIRAWSRLGQGATRDWVLAIAGWGQDGHEGELKRLTKELGQERGVLFLGPQFSDSKASCLANATGFVLPSLGEGLPVAVLEAWAHGLPVLMTQECNLPEGFAAGAAMRIVASVDGILPCLMEFMEMSENDRQEMGRRGKALARERYSWSKISDDMFNCYRWVLGGGTPPSNIILR